MEENEKSLKSLNQKEENLDTFYLSLDNNIYSINITKNNNNDKIIISAKSGSERNIVNNLCFYDNSFSLQELISKSKPFKLCDTINDAYNIFIDIIKAQKVFLKKSDDVEEYKPYNILIFVIKISLPGGQEQDVEFELNQKQMDKDQYINELILLIEKLHKENEELKYENALKNDEIKLLKKKYGLNKIENKFNNHKNKSFDNKRSILNTNLINPNYTHFFKYGYHDIHNNTDIHNIINYNNLYNSNNINLSKINNNNKDDYNNLKSFNNISKLFQSTMSSFKKGRLTKMSNNSSNITNDFFETKNTMLSKSNKDNNLTKINTFNKTKKKKEIELNNVIYIKNDNNKVTMIPIEDYMSIRQIKINYCSKKFIPLKGKELYYKGKKLNDEKNLEFYNIPWESTLYVFNVPEKINVYVRCLSGKEFKIIADELETILKIKIKIYEYENIPVDKQIVLMDKKILDDEKTISELNRNGDVHLLVRRKGES